ncbi:hypothetical protein V1264_023532 [Littorina saxatilis]|uniref:Uncharacterized protein n=2 Tax=Littorina saxatilis TaxID=31220 RepID=A0AAN9B824_9CAEN
MRELRESLRHAALLNIVAAANNDPAFRDLPPHDPRPQLQGVAPSHLAPPHHQRRRVTSPLALQVTSSRGSPIPQTTENGGRSAGSGTYHIPSPCPESGGSSPQTLVANLLSPRIRTISIPRPGARANDLPGPFIHRSATQAKECLSRVGELVRSRTEGVESATTHDVAALKMTVSGGGLQLVQGHALIDTARSHGNATQTFRNASAAKTFSAMSRDTTVSRNSGPPPSASHGSESSRTTTSDLRTRKGGAKSSNGEETRASSGQQMISVRRHLTAGKKLELVKRLTEMAKCEAVDMNDPLASEDEGVDGGVDDCVGGGGAPSTFMPPMIIMSQQRYDKSQQNFSSSSLAAESVGFSQNTMVDSELPGATRNSPTTTTTTTNLTMYRAKSLSSLMASNNYNYMSNSRNKASSHNPDTHPTAQNTLERTVSGSMPDLMEGLEASERKQHYTLERNDSGDRIGLDDSLFTDGIVGKTIRKKGEAEGEGGMGLVESRPLLPATPSIRSQRGTRPSGRRSSLGPLDPATPAGPKLTSTTTYVLNLAPSSNPATKGSKPASDIPTGTMPLDYISSYTPTLPTLTITGLQREKTVTGGEPASTSRAARELRPANKNSVSSSMELFQQLDDQCEKLQRQLNISVNVPTRRSHTWQHGTPPATPINRTDVSAHLQCVSLGDGGRETGNTTPSSPSSSSLLRRPQYLRNNTVATALSDVDEHSHVGTAGGGGFTDRTLLSDWRHHADHQVNGLERNYTHRTLESENTDNGFASYGLNVVPLPDTAEVEASRRMLMSSDNDVIGRPGVGAPPSFSDPSPDSTSGALADPVSKFKGVKEPRYQGSSSRVPEGEVRSQFHYVHPSHMAESEEAREMKYRVLKALDQDVYYDFQHRKYRNTPAAATAPAPAATSASRCSKEEDRPRVHFFKVKVEGSHE